MDEGQPQAKLARDKINGQQHQEGSKTFRPACKRTFAFCHLHNLSVGKSSSPGYDAVKSLGENRTTVKGTLWTVYALRSRIRQPDTPSKTCDLGPYKSAIDLACLHSPWASSCQLSVRHRHLSDLKNFMATQTNT